MTFCAAHPWESTAYHQVLGTVLARPSLEVRKPEGGKPWWWCWRSIDVDDLNARPYEEMRAVFRLAALEAAAGVDDDGEVCRACMLAAHREADVDVYAFWLRHWEQLASYGCAWLRYEAVRTVLGEVAPSPGPLTGRRRWRWGWEQLLVRSRGWDGHKIGGVDPVVQAAVLPEDYDPALDGTCRYELLGERWDAAPGSVVVMTADEVRAEGQRLVLSNERGLPAGPLALTSGSS